MAIQVIVVIVVLALVFGGGPRWGWYPAEGNARSIIWTIVGVLVLLWLLGATGILGGSLRFR